MIFDHRGITRKHQSSAVRLKKVVSLCFLFLAVILAYYQILRGNYFSKRARNNYVRVVPIYSVRGSIVDKNGVILARDKACFNLGVIPHQIKNKKTQLFRQLEEILNLGRGTIEKKYKRNLRGFFSPTNIITDVGKKKALALKALFPDLLVINPEPQREYPKAYDFSHILGYVKKASSLEGKFKKYGYRPLERIGIYGIEQYYDSYLRGQDGGDLLEIDAKGNTVGFLGRKSPHRGKNIQLTIDSRVQNAARESLSAKTGTIILLDTVSGEITALYSSPAFDPNLFIAGKDINRIYQNQDNPFINRVIQSSFPIGSLIKPLLATAALEEKIITPKKTFDCRGKFSLGNTSFACWSTHGEQNLYQALAHSCNVYFYNLGLLLGPEAINSWLVRFGLNAKTGIDLPYEKKGFVPGPEWKRKKMRQSWYAGDTLNLSIGQGFIHTTPLAITMAINSLANGGYLLKPVLIKKIGALKNREIKKTNLCIEKRTLEQVTKGMRKAVGDDSGTARMLKNLSLGICGKTGTAQAKKSPHAWFIGFFPYSKPKYTLSVFLENGGSSHQALKVARIFLKKIIKKNMLELN